MTAFTMLAGAVNALIHKRACGSVSIGQPCAEMIVACLRRRRPRISVYAVGRVRPALISHPPLYVCTYIHTYILRAASSNDGMGRYDEGSPCRPSLGGSPLSGTHPVSAPATTGKD